MTNKNRFLSIFLAVAAFSAAAAETDSISYGEQRLETAYGYTESRDSYTGSQSSVKASELETWKGPSLDAAMRGKLSGWYNNVVRGQSSPYGATPLVVLDGVPMPFIALTELDPTTVEDVTILKDAAAKVLYGPSGAQGVILVTSKHGRNNSMKVEVSGNVGFMSPTNNPEMLDVYDQALMRNQALINDGLAPKFNSSQLADFRDGLGVNNDWRKMYLDDSFFQKYNVQVGAGSQKVRFYINVGFSRESGKYKIDYSDKYNPSDFNNRFTVVSNLDVDITPWLRAFANTNIGVKRINSTREAAGGIYQKIYTTPNWVRDGVTESGAIITTEGYPNPIYGAINYSGLNQMTATNLAANMGLDFDLGFVTKGLGFKGVFGYSSMYNGIRGGSYDYARVIYNPETDSYVPWLANVPAPLAWAKGTTTNYYMDIQAMVDYHRTFAEDHSVDAVAHYTYQDYRGDASKWYSYAFILPANRIEYAAEAKYGYKNRYFIQGDMNYSGAETLAEGNQFHFSPTVSGAWVASNEEWFPTSTVSYLKFRASYGALFYDSLRDMDSRYLYNSVYREGTGGIPGIFSGYGINDLRRGTPGISWEKSRQQDYGFDISFLNKLNLTFDYWRTNQEGVLLQSELASMVGGVTAANRPYTNDGKILNQGVDLSLNYATRLASGLGISVTGQMGWNKNEWLSASELSYKDANYAYEYRKTGYSIGQAWGFLVDESNGSMFWNSQDEIKASGLSFTGKQPRPGDLKFQDLNGDKVIDEGDYAPLEGCYNIPRIEYGLQLNLDYKGFDLGLDFIGDAGRSILLNSSVGVAEYVAGQTTEGVYMPHHLTAWTAERLADGATINYPALSSGLSASLQPNDFFVSKLDYMRLRTATLGYTLPASLTKHVGMSKCRVYVNGQNLFSVSNLKFDNLDPEVAHIYQKVYRTINLGLNINF